MSKPVRHRAGAAYEETLGSIRGIQRGFEGMKSGTGKPFRAALEEIRARHKIPAAINDDAEPAEE